MIGRSVSTRCKICRMLGIFPLFLAASASAWLAADTFSWATSILVFMLVLILGALVLRSGCYILFPDLPPVEKGDFADPADFVADLETAQPNELAPGLLDPHFAADGSVDDPSDLSGSDPLLDVALEHETVWANTTNIFQNSIQDDTPEPVFLAEPMPEPEQDALPQPEPEPTIEPVAPIQAQSEVIPLANHIRKPRFEDVDIEKLMPIPRGQPGTSSSAVVSEFTTLFQRGSDDEAPSAQNSNTTVFEEETPLHENSVEPAEGTSAEHEKLEDQSLQAEPEAALETGSDARPDTGPKARLPQIQSQEDRPTRDLGDPGRRLAQNLVMVGASPALGLSASQTGSQTLRPASLQSARSTGPDDLQQISGVGDALEELLHALGYFHFDQIAAWTAQEIQWVDENLVGFKGRVSRDNWVPQAIVLAQAQRRTASGNDIG